MCVPSPVGFFLMRLHSICKHSSRDGNGYPVPAYPAGKNPIRARVWDQRKPMGI